MEKKTLSELLKDTCIYFKEKYGNNAEYMSSYYTIPLTVVPLTISGSKDTDKYAIMISEREDSSNYRLILTRIAPDLGDNYSLHGILAEANSAFEGFNKLWMYPTDSLGGVGCIKNIIFFDPNRKVSDELRLEFFQKINELFYSDQYQTDVFRHPVKEIQKP